MDRLERGDVNLGRISRRGVGKGGQHGGGRKVQSKGPRGLTGGRCEDDF